MENKESVKSCLERQTWILMCCYSSKCGIYSEKFYATENEAKKHMLKVIEEDALYDGDEPEEDYGGRTRSIEEIEDGRYTFGGTKSFYGFRAHDDYHVEYTLIRLDDIKETKLGE